MRHGQGGKKEQYCLAAVERGPPRREAVTQLDVKGRKKPPVEVGGRTCHGRLTCKEKDKQQ
eukprot:9598014-Prorocentrum_lima.AAC.1